MFKKCVSSVLAFGMALSLGFSSFAGNVNAEQSDTAKRISYAIRTNVKRF